MEFMEMFYNILNTDDYKEIDLQKTTHGVEEISEFEFVDPKTNNILPKFLTETDIAADIKSGRAKIYNYI